MLVLGLTTTNTHLINLHPGQFNSKGNRDLRIIPRNQFLALRIILKSDQNHNQVTTMTSQSTTSTPPSQIQIQKHILILGAGISALQTALTLLTSPSTKHHKVTLVAQHIPGDQSPAYTSPWAGGHWRSHATSAEGDERLRSWDARTYEAWCELLESGDGEVEGESMGERERRMGIGFRPSVNFWGRECEETVEGGRGLWWREGVVRGFEVLPLSQFPVRKGPGQEGSELVFGVGYKTICFNPSTYLLYLFNRIQSLGATVIKSPLDNKNGLKGIITAAKLLLKEKELQDLDILINCAGLSARHFLPAEEAHNLFPIRGQTILVKGDAAKAHTITNLRDVSTDEVLYIIPRPGTGTTILGGYKQAGNFDEGVDEELSRRILERARDWGVAEELRGVEGGFEVLSMQVGFRPGRKGGPRVEVEEWVEAVRLVHCYGHAGAGYQNSVGCAEEVRGLIEGLE